MRQYADLKEQAAEFDPDELQDAGLALRPAIKHSAVDRVQSAYGGKYGPLVMYDSKRDVADMLNEEAKPKSIRGVLRKKQQREPQEERRQKQAHREQER